MTHEASITAPGEIDEKRRALLQLLTVRHPEFLVWKHLDRALRGRGDIDAAAPSAVVAQVAATARAHGGEILGAPVAIECTHVADKLLTFFVQDRRFPQLFELDLGTQPVRGLAPWAGPEQMGRLAVVDGTGVRRLRPGAEAIVSLVYHGISMRPSRLDPDEAAIISAGVAADRAGAQQAIHDLVPPLARPGVRAALSAVAPPGRAVGGQRAVSEGRLALAGFVATALMHPRFMLHRTAFQVKLRSGRECSMSRLARFHGRRASGTMDDLLAMATGDGHVIHPL